MPRLSIGAGIEAERRGYSHAMIAARELEGSVEEIGRHLAHMALQRRDNNGPILSNHGGEGTVSLAPCNTAVEAGVINKRSWPLSMNWGNTGNHLLAGS